MLVLSRREGQSLVIGGVVTLTIMKSQCGRTSISIDAPRSVTVNRLEIEERIRKEKQLAVKNEGTK